MPVLNGYMNIAEAAEILGIHAGTHITRVITPTC